MLSSRLRTLAFAIALAAAPLALAPRALADIVHLNTGGVVKGEIIAETDEGVKIKTATGGVTTIFREDIERIERGASPEATYQERLKKLAPNDAEGHYQLGAYLKKIRLDKEARECFEKALKIDPTHFPARAALSEEAARREALVAVAEDDRGVASEPAPTVKGKIPGETFKQLEALKAKTRDWAVTPEKRLEAWEAIAALHAGSVDPAQKEAIAAYAIAIETGHRKLYDKNARRLAGAIPDYDKPEQRKIRDRYRETWEKSVEAALAVIFDLKIYPDENHGKVGQPTVDEKVDVVKKAFPAYDTLVTHDLARFNAIGDDQAKIFAAVLEKSRGLEIEALAALEKMGIQGMKPPPEEPPAAHRALLLYRAGRVEDAYAARDSSEGALSPWEVRLLDRLRDLRVESYNDRQLKDPAPPAKGKRPNGEERKQVAITNTYRMLMGRPALEIHPCLIESARGHSNEMTLLGYFAHESPVQRNRTPNDRAHNAGYDSGAAENISMGSVSAQATHDAWYNSSGHHRNILGSGHKAMGSGLDGQHWTQNFGSFGELVR